MKIFGVRNDEVRKEIMTHLMKRMILLNNNIVNMNRGSEWRQWDLHFHTPASYDYDDNSVTNQDIINGLVANEISAVAITDHHFIDVPRIKELQDLGRGKITVFPGI